MRVGAVDIGTNTAKLLIADVSRADIDIIVEPIHRAVTITGLGRGVERNRMLDPAAMGRAVAVLRGYGAAAARFNCDSMLAVATAAVRLSSNGPEFLDRAQTALGARPLLLDGDDEAALAFRGARFGLDVEPPVLLVDPGGGSTELAMGKTKPEFGVSLDVGSRRITERRLARVPVASGAIAAARSDVADLLDDVTLPERPASVVGIGGTLTTLGALALGTSSVAHGSLLPIETITSTIGLLAAMSTEQIARIPGVPPGRADVLLGGAVIVEQVMVHADAAEIIVSSGGLIDGLALEAAENL
ncbi:MAG: hypothetical protein KJN71_05470 [Acidimicrobiia bacterium]|nr:hypothetical protein [Acidimicrobiia bacterium]NNC75733.1 hypothetical protein [Acidimicrobiia bacterium]